MKRITALLLALAVFAAGVPASAHGCHGGGCHGGGGYQGGCPYHGDGCQSGCPYYGGSASGWDNGGSGGTSGPPQDAAPDSSENAAQGGGEDTGAVDSAPPASAPPVSDPPAPAPETPVQAPEASGQDAPAAPSTPAPTPAPTPVPTPVSTPAPTERAANWQDSSLRVTVGGEEEPSGEKLRDLIERTEKELHAAYEELTKGLDPAILTREANLALYREAYSKCGFTETADRGLQGGKRSIEEYARAHPEKYALATGSLAKADPEMRGRILAARREIIYAAKRGAQGWSTESVLSASVDYAGREYGIRPCTQDYFPQWEQLPEEYVPEFQQEEGLLGRTLCGAELGCYSALLLTGGRSGAVTL